MTQFPECVAFQQRLAAAAAVGLENPFFRVKEHVHKATATIAGREVVSYTSFDYLGMGGDPRVIAAAKQAIDDLGMSASASRLVGGNHRLVQQLDEEIARFVGTEAAVAFPSGYGTNASVLGHLFGAEDLILYDELAHNSIVQGTLLSKAQRRPFPHNDVEFLDKLLGDVRSGYRRVVVALEGVYSMDGDYPNLPRFVEVKRRHGALLYVDEAHSIGVMGRTGRGICEHFGVDPADGDLWMGTISKALGSCGGYLAGRAPLIQYLKYTTPSFVFATGLSPAAAAAALTSLRLLQQEPEPPDAAAKPLAVASEVSRRLRPQHRPQRRHAGDPDHRGQFGALRAARLPVAPAGHRRAADPLSGRAGKPVAAPLLRHRRAYRRADLPHRAGVRRVPRRVPSADRRGLKNRRRAEFCLAPEAHEEAEHLVRVARLPGDGEGEVQGDRRRAHRRHHDPQAEAGRHAVLVRSSC